MKVYAAPEDIKLVPDYRNYDRAAEQKKEDDYIAAIKAKMVELGYNGPRTGEIARFPVADGYAQYMFCDGGRRSCLVHLDILDGYQFPYVSRLTKADIIREIDQSKAMDKLFAKR